MIGAPKVGPARPKIVSAQPSPLAQPNPQGWAGLDFRKPSLDEAKWSLVSPQFPDLANPKNISLPTFLFKFSFLLSFAVKNKTWRTKSQFMLGKNLAARFLWAVASPAQPAPAQPGLTKVRPACSNPARWQKRPARPSLHSISKLPRKVQHKHIVTRKDKSLDFVEINLGKFMGYYIQQMLLYTI